MRIEQIMSQPVATCRTDDTLHTAARIMWEHDCGALPVTDERNSVVGMVTDRDICMATFTQGLAPQAIPVSTAMARHVHACHAGDSIESAEQLMGKHQVRRIPVLDGDNHPIGMLSLNDLSRHGAARKKSSLEHEVVQTMAAICEPRAQSLREYR